jgi:hypothetical protein
LSIFRRRRRPWSSSSSILGLLFVLLMFAFMLIIVHDRPTTTANLAPQQLADVLGVDVTHLVQLREVDDVDPVRWWVWLGRSGR